MKLPKVLASNFLRMIIGAWWGVVVCPFLYPESCVTPSNSSEKWSAVHVTISPIVSVFLEIVYSIYYLQPFESPRSWSCRNIVLHPQQFGLVDVGLVKKKREERWQVYASGYWWSRSMPFHFLEKCAVSLKSNGRKSAVHMALSALPVYPHPSFAYPSIVSSLAVMC